MKNDYLLDAPLQIVHRCEHYRHADQTISSNAYLTLAISLSVSDFTLPDICCMESIRTASHGFFYH